MCKKPSKLRVRIIRESLKEDLEFKKYLYRQVYECMHGLNEKLETDIVLTQRSRNRGQGGQRE